MIQSCAPQSPDSKFIEAGSSWTHYKIIDLFALHLAVVGVTHQPRVRHFPRAHLSYGL